MVPHWALVVVTSLLMPSLLLATEPQSQGDLAAVLPSSANGFYLQSYLTRELVFALQLKAEDIDDPELRSWAEYAHGEIAREQEAERLAAASLESLAMIAHKYRDTPAGEKALLALRSLGWKTDNSGRQYDPGVVQVFSFNIAGP